MKSTLVTILTRESYLAMIHNSVGTHMFRALYARVQGKKMDIMREGDLSCAFFVSSLLVGFSLIKSVHATVEGTMKDLQSSGWKRIKSPKAGCVIVWEPMIDKKGELHKHIGFYIGNGKAISNDSETGSPQTHPYKSRKVNAYYWNAKLK